MNRPGKIIKPSTIQDLPEFEIKKSNIDQILEYFKNNDKGFARIIAEKTSVPETSIPITLRHLNKIGYLIDSGFSTITWKGTTSRVHLYKVKK